MRSDARRNYKGYFETPNMYVPHNNREKGEIAEIAYEQLKPWQDLAHNWCVMQERRWDPRDEVWRDCNTCAECDENIWFSSDVEGAAYSYTDDEVNALIVAHIRQCHDDWMENGRVTTKEP